MDLSQSQAPKKADQFPRGTNLPRQSPKYWVKEKDRYIRQQLIGDIEEQTGRPLLVYFSQLDHEIDHSDPDDISEILSGIKAREIDFLIQTPGGNIDAAEKIISILKQRTESYRIIVPSWAKSAGTVLALSSTTIVLGVNSELGPIDPQWKTANGPIPCEIIAKDTGQPIHIRLMAEAAVARARALAKQLLNDGMMKGKSEKDLQDILAKISSHEGYLSHGAVMDCNEAQSLGLNVCYLKPDDELWRRIWLLYCMYEFDTKQSNLGKIFEGSIYSISRPRLTNGQPRV